MSWNLRLFSCGLSELYESVGAMGIDTRQLAQVADCIVAGEGLANEVAALGQYLESSGITMLVGSDNSTNQGHLVPFLVVGSAAQLHQAADNLRQDTAQTIRDFCASLEQILDGLTAPKTPLLVRNTTFKWGERTFVMGIINATPDSFSGDGTLRSTDDSRQASEAAVSQGLAFAEYGADILDIGGESSRPGSKPVEEAEELDRVLPVIRGIRSKSNIPISIDTVKSAVARAALDEGADIINDISGLQDDPAMARLAAEKHVPVVLMHRKPASASTGVYGGHFTSGHPTPASLDSLMVEITAGLGQLVAAAISAGVYADHIIVDPGIGFGKAREENLYIVNHLAEFKQLGLPILLGVSRKAFIGYTLNTPVTERLEGTAAAVCVGIVRGADVIRVHDVQAMVRVARMTDALVRT